MSTTENPLELAALELAGAVLKVNYSNGKGEKFSHQPDWIRVNPRGMYLEWPNPPPDLQQIQIEWSNNPFVSHIFRCQCTVTESGSAGVEVEFKDPPPASLQDWFNGMTAILGYPQADPALRTSKLYTRATVISAVGLLCGVLAIVLPILIGDRGWVDFISKFLLVLMLASIGAFAWLRALAGREEARAIAQGRE